MTPQDFLDAARVPRHLYPAPQKFGLWTLERIASQGQLISPGSQAMMFEMVGYPDYTLLRHYTLACEMGKPAEIVMEDSARELRKHLPIWMAARGRVLITGLGLGCVVRGLLANQDVDEIDVVEFDENILAVVGPEFARNPRVNLHAGDALTISFRDDVRWDYGWHDLWCDGEGLHSMHIRLLMKFRWRCGPQGAWAFPRYFGKVFARKGFQLLGAPRHV